MSAFSISLGVVQGKQANIGNNSRFDNHLTLIKV